MIGISDPNVMFKGPGSFLGKAANYVTAFPKNAGNSLHQKC